MDNLIGRRFGKWVVIKRTDNNIGKLVKWTCLCDCGNIKEIHASVLKNGKSTDCGCSKIRNLMGRNFGRLTVIEKDLSSKKRKKWICKCECGNVVSTREDGLLNGNTSSCGCLRVENLLKANKKYNKYNLDGDYGIGYTSNTDEEFYFDLEDYDKIKDYCWSNYGNYISSTTNGKSIRIHNVIMNSNWIDHINGSSSTFDNRKSNLRTCNNQENQWYRTESSTNTSGHKGVVKYNNGTKDYWRGQLTIKGKQYTKSYPILDYGDSVAYELACKWVEEKDVELHGEFSPYYNSKIDCSLIEWEEDEK